MLGVVVTLIVTQVLKNFGKIIVYTEMNRIRYFRNLERLSMSTKYTKSESLDTSTRVLLDFDVVFFNSKEVLVGFRNIELKFFHDDIHLFSKDVYNKNGDIVKFLNLPPKTMVNQDIICELTGTELDKYKKHFNNVKLKCDDHKGKTIFLKIDSSNLIDK